MTKATVTIEASLNWAFIATPNDGGMYPSGKFEAEYCNLSDADVAKLEATGLTVKTDEKGQDKGRFIKAKSKPSDSGARQFKVHDKTYGVPFPDAQLGTIGNGSKVRALIKTYDVTKGIAAGTYGMMGDIIVTDLEVYNGGGADADVMAEFTQGVEAKPAAEDIPWDTEAVGAF